MKHRRPLAGDAITQTLTILIVPHVIVLFFPPPPQFSFFFLSLLGSFRGILFLKAGTLKCAHWRRVVRRRRRVEGCPVEGCPAEGGSSGPSEIGCRVRGFGFSSGFGGRKQKQNKNKLKRDEKEQKKVMKSKKTKQKKK